MAQHDFEIDNGPGQSVRLDFQAALQALATQNSGTTEPSVMYPGMVWFDTSDGKVKMRNQANSAWVDLATMAGMLPLASGGVAVGTYTPTFTGVTNVASAAGVAGYYVRAGNLVAVFARGTVQPTAAAPTTTTFRISLPVASNFDAGNDQAIGIDVNNVTTNSASIVTSDTTNDAVSVTFSAGATTNATHVAVFIYEII